MSAAGLIVLAPIVLVATWAIGPIWNSIDKAAYDSQMIRHYQMLVAEKPAYGIAISRASAMLATQGMLFPDGSAELVSAQLQNTLQGLVLQANGQMQSSEIIPPQAASGLKILAVSLSFSLPSSQLARMLAALDAEKPLLTVQAIDLRSTDGGAGTGPLDVQMQVSGFMGGS